MKNEFERKKQEILAVQSASSVDGETNSAIQLAQLSEIDIWVQSVGGKKKGKVKGLGSLGRSVKATNSSTSTLPKEINEMIKSQVDASNANLYAQLQNERKKNKRMRKDLHLLMKHVYNKSSSNNERPSQEDYQAFEDESYDDSNNVNGSDNPDNVNESDSDPDSWKCSFGVEEQGVREKIGDSSSKTDETIGEFIYERPRIVELAEYVRHQGWLHLLEEPIPSVLEGEVRPQSRRSDRDRGSVPRSHCADRLD
ncbi:putative suppressor protein SRP40-like isoform X2 [Capsicum annuum]|nr:putative suppressor protein SRP40-like isoform X2 [Capsicum annuum]KAF3659614.1 putative suppressor protein SRP40-like isoform X2 [Capsicum annuum]